MKLDVGYIRVSSDKQDSQRQRDELAPLKLDALYVDDVGRNSRDQPEKRKEFQRLMSDVEKGRVKAIYIDRQDRFGAKDSYQFGSFITLLRNNGCALLDATGKCLSADDDASILTNAIGSIASRREQQEKAHRNVTGKVPAARAGLYQGGYAPFGLDVVCFRVGVEVWRVVYIGRFDRFKVYPDGTRERFSGKGNFPASDPTDELRLRPNAERLQTVRDIFKWFTEESISPGAIGKRLATLGVDPVFGKWDKQKIYKLLENPVYVGLPSWNKRGASRFSEFKDGKVQTVTDARLGRVRSKSDYVQPEVTQFEPIVDPEVFAKAQARLEAGKQGKYAKANTASLWLRPFLRCGKCGGPMHGANHTSRNRITPSYFCSTYNRYGKDACKCHRVRHSVLEGVVKAYLEQTGPKIDALLQSPTKVPDVNLTEENRAYFDVCCDMIAIEAQHDAPYDEVYERLLPQIQSQLDEKEVEMNRLVESYADLPAAVRHRINGRLEKLEAEIDDLRRQKVDLRIPREEALNALNARKAEVAAAVEAVQSDSDYRRMTEALRPVIDRIVLHHTYTPGGKSTLESVEIVPCSGEVITVASPGPG